MGIASDLTALKELSDDVVANKVSRFCYTESAYTLNQADGVIDYDVNRGQNIPVGTPTVMKVNQTVVDKGYRTQGSSLTRMLMNHFFGRISYNLNKINDWFNTLLINLSASLGSANGIATLDNDGHLIQQSPVGSVNVPMTKSFLGAVFGALLGRSWKQATGNSTEQLDLLAYANGIWVCTSENDERMWWSEDGKAWTQCTISAQYGIRDIKYGNGLWVCCSSDGTWWSENGKAWNTVTVTSGTFEQGRELVYANGLWVCGGYDAVWWSTDGKAWTQGTIGSCSNMHRLTYANGIWVCCGSDSSGMWWSEDGKAWTQGTGNANRDMHDLTFGNGLWVVLSKEYGVWWSENGKAWTQGTGGYDEYITDDYDRVLYANGMWVIGGKNAWWSTDGKAWTQCTGFSSEYFITLQNLSYANGVYIGGSSSAGAWYSIDGKYWKQSNLGNTKWVSNFYYVNGMWLCVVGTTSSTKEGIWYSTDGGASWSQSSGLSNLFLEHILYAKGVIVAVSTNHTSLGAGNGAWYSSIDDLISEGAVNLGANIPLIDA